MMQRFSFDFCIATRAGVGYSSRYTRNSGISRHLSQGAATMKSGEGVNSYIGKEVVLHGEITGTEDLFLDGQFEGSINLQDSKLTIGPNARLRANVNSRDVVVMGKVAGNITASGRVEMRHTSSLAGEIVAVHLMVEDGATIMGKVEVVQPARPVAVIPRPSENSLHAVYSDTAEKKEPQHDPADAAVAIASNQ
jgi:cytoskeletal protein CcmA (bactofilin family)